MIAELDHPVGPVVAEHDLGRLPHHLLHPEDLQVPDVVHSPLALLGVRRALVVPLLVVPILEYPRDPADADPVDPDHTRVAQVVDVGSHPPAVGQLLQVVGGLVVAPDEKCQHWGLEFPGVVLGEGAHVVHVFLRPGHGPGVAGNPDGLEVAAAEEEVDFEAGLTLTGLDCGVDLLEVAMSAALYRHAHLLIFKMRNSIQLE